MNRLLLSRIVCAIALSLVAVALIKGLTSLEISWWHYVAIFIGTFIVANPSETIWSMIYDFYQYSENVDTSVKPTIGEMRDLNEDEGFIVYVRGNGNGLFLTRPSIIPFLSSTSLIPWRDIDIIKITELGGQFGEDCEHFDAEIKIDLVKPKIKLPWNAGLQKMFSLQKDKLLS